MQISTISKTILTLILSILDIRTSNTCAYFLFKFVHKSCSFFTLSTIEIVDALYRKSISNTVARLTVFIVETPKSIGTKAQEERSAIGNKIQNASFPCFHGFRTRKMYLLFPLYFPMKIFQNICVLLSVSGPHFAKLCCAFVYPSISALCVYIFEQICLRNESRESCEPTWETIARFGDDARMVNGLLNLAPVEMTPMTFSYIFYLQIYMTGPSFHFSIFFFN